MEDTVQKIQDIDEKLIKGAEDLTFIQESLSKSSQMTSNMVTILTSFEERLAMLEQNILPVHRETVSLQKLQENLSVTLSVFDDVLSHHDAVRDLEQAVKAGAGNGLEQYLSHMQQIEDAKNFFEEHNPSSPELAKATLLFNTGKDSLQNEFRVLLSRHGQPVPPTMVLELIAAEDEDFPSDNVSLSLSQMPESAMEDLTEIAKWLKDHSKTLDFIDIYHATRSIVLKKSLELMKEHLRRNAAPSSGNFSPMVTAGKAHKLKDTPRGRTGSNLRPVVARKGSSASQSSKGEASGRKYNTLAPDFNVDLDSEIENYLYCVSGLLKLMQSEALIMTGIIPGEHQRKTFDKITEKAMTMIFQDGEAISSAAKRAVLKHDYTAVLTVFPVAKHLSQIRPEFEETLQGTTPTTRSKLPTLIASLETTGAKALEEFFDVVKNDPDKSNMPRDGTVHELTSNALTFLEHFLDYIDTTAAMLTAHRDQGYSAKTTDVEANKRQVSNYVAKVLGALSLNLDQKAKTYSDQYLGAIFLLNNYHFILKSLERYDLTKLVIISTPDIESHYAEIIKEQKREYSKSWNKVLSHILETNKPMSSQRMALEAAKLKDKERQQIKDKFKEQFTYKVKDKKERQQIKDIFKGFNQDFEELYKTQKSYAIPHAELRAALRKENKDLIVQPYQVFRDKYMLINFTKNPNKYMKLTTEMVAAYIDRFFDITA
ncbi:exocyst complex component 7-like isoform X1 [Patiria miniata]|uniref:Exocyst complex component 7 n=2 Tax=Patiria miniata TaxID=46514 RepID=A0A913Z8G3_PATMI|nr:exocyst complex component 7-like isoform X1 [Patiria miniata]